MTRRAWRSVFLLLAMLAAWPVVTGAGAPRIVAVGDLHGDFAAWRGIARDAGLIDAGGRWTGGSTILVQTGDIVDRGPDGRRIVEDLMRLQREAKRASGRVVVLVGNHEAMNVTDDLRYVSAADFAAYATPDSAATRDRVYKANRTAIEIAYRARDPAITSDAIRAAWIAETPLGKIEHQRAWHPAGAIGRWVIGNPAVALIDGTLFVHGGLSAAYAAQSIAEINRQVAAALSRQDTEPTAIINDPAGPLWYRGLAVSPASSMPTAASAELDTVLQRTGARRMVIGHTPLLSGIAVLADGRLVRIDTGISSAYGGVPSYLEIVDGKPIPHAVPRPAVTTGGP